MIQTENKEQQRESNRGPVGVMSRVAVACSSSSGLAFRACHVHLELSAAPRWLLNRIDGGNQRVRRKRGLNVEAAVGRARGERDVM